MLRNCEWLNDNGTQGRNTCWDVGVSWSGTDMLAVLRLVMCEHIGSSNLWKHCNRGELWASMTSPSQASSHGNSLTKHILFLSLSLCIHAKGKIGWVGSFCTLSTQWQRGARLSRGEGGKGTEPSERSAHQRRTNTGKLTERCRRTEGKHDGVQMKDTGRPHWQN